MKCQTCKREMTEAEDRGGDCVFCMAEAGDTDCALDAYLLLKKQRDGLCEALVLIEAGSTPARFIAKLALAKAKP